MITVEARNEGEDWVCAVSVRERRGQTTVYEVTVSRQDLATYGRGRAPEDLVRDSFEFLLEREPPSAILRRFDLPTIERYFPEYPRLI